MRRARLLAVTVVLAVGALGTISSTQTWLSVTLRQGPDGALLVPGAAALPVLAPLSLAVLALGAALSIVGLVLRYAFGALTVVIAGVLAWLTGVVVFQRPPSAAASTVTEATGITGLDAVAELVERVTLTPWPAVTLIAWMVLLAAGAFVIATASTWKGAGRRYRTDAAAATAAPASGSTPTSASAVASPSASASTPLDAVDSWDGLSRGEDPTR
ncbi:Trp biosynthesis-associated membrane protein [Microbacterium sp. DT81.1]|uniref:Trp biosynthesis-associated membrane protein n=1 Tax=Microbacterium sp. DT81.1 TaxID=3393413 RepID=UPI003CF3F725